MRPYRSWRNDWRGRPDASSIARPSVVLSSALGSREKKDLHATERDRPEVLQEREAFRRWRESIPRHRLVFADEFGFNCAMTPAFGRSPRGQRAYSAVPFNPGRNLTLTVSLRITGPIAPFVVYGGTDGDVFTTYVETQLIPLLRSRDVLVVDDLGAHRSVAARAVLRARGVLLKRLPPYSPDFNPVEACGSKVKEFVRRAEPRSEQEIIEAISQALTTVTGSDARRWFEHYGYHPYSPERRP
jgi:transposase